MFESFEFLFHLPFSYYVFEITFLAFPVLSIYITKKVPLGKIRTYYLPTAFFLVLHSFSCYHGVSFRGDYADYVCFSLLYLAFCMAVGYAWADTRNILIKVLRIPGTVLFALGFSTGIIGILLFILISQDFEYDKKFCWVNSGKNYETRRFEFGAMNSDTRYTFITYRPCSVLPLEQKIDGTDFFYDKTKLRISEDELKINIIEKKGFRFLEFESTNGQKFIKPLY